MYKRLLHFSRPKLTAKVNTPKVSMTTEKFGSEAQVKRNPHGDFKKVESSRDDFDNAKTWIYTKTAKPDWKVGDGANDLSQVSKKIEVDPYGDGRAPVDNYKLLISAVTPRPIGFISTMGKDGVKNLATFSYFSVVNHDPPLFTVGFSSGKSNPKDTLRNLLETEECTINIISEWFIEAANYSCVIAPYEVDEWKLTGLTQSPSSKVKPPHVAESAFSAECTLKASHGWTSKTDPNKETGTLCILEGVNFHIGETVINPELNNIDIAKLKPISRLGGITYARTMDGFEIPRPDYKKEEYEGLESTV